MKLYKYSFLALALAGMMVACDNGVDDNYTIGGDSAGAFFPLTAPELVEITEGSSSVSIPVFRGKATAEETYNLKVEDESGVFTFPSAVTFASDATEAQINVTFDAAQIVPDKKYPVTISIEDEKSNNYGNATYSFDLQLPYEMIEENTTGTYTYTYWWEGDDPDLPVTISYPAKKPEYKTYTVQHWGADVDFVIEMPGDVDADGYNTCFVHPTYIGYDHSSYGPVYTADYYTYWKEFRGMDPAELEDVRDMSYYNPETGAFNLFMIYFAEAGFFGYDYEFLQLAGFPDYSVEVAYDGLWFPSNSESSFARLTVNSSPDCEFVRVALVKDDDPNNYIESILDGSYDHQDVASGSGVVVDFELEGSGTYYALAFSYANNDPQDMAYTTFEVAGAGVDSEWTKVGTAKWVDGWILPAFGYYEDENDPNSWVVLNPFDYEYEVVCQESKTTPGVYRFVNPYYGEDAPLGELNKNQSTPYSIVIDLSHNDVPLMLPQNSGFYFPISFNTNQGTVSIDYWIIENPLGMYVDGNTDMTVEEIIDVMESDPDYFEGDFSTYEDGVIFVETPLFGNGTAIFSMPAFSGAGYPSQITMPGADANAAAAKMVKRTVSHNVALVNVQKTVTQLKKATIQDSKKLRKINMGSYIQPNVINRKLK